MRGKRLFIVLSKVRSRGASNPIERRRFLLENAAIKVEPRLFRNELPSLNRNWFKAVFILSESFFGRNKNPPRVKKYSPNEKEKEK